MLGADAVVVGYHDVNGVPEPFAIDSYLANYSPCNPGFPPANAIDGVCQDTVIGDSPGGHLACTPSHTLTFELSTCPATQGSDVNTYLVLP